MNPKAVSLRFLYVPEKAREQLESIIEEITFDCLPSVGERK